MYYRPKHDSNSETNQIISTRYKINFVDWRRITFLAFMFLVTPLDQGMPANTAGNTNKDVKTISMTSKKIQIFKSITQGQVHRDRENQEGQRLRIGTGAQRNRRSGRSC